MLLVAPYQTIDPSNITIDPYYKDKRQRSIAPLYYTQNGLRLQGITLLSPPLQVLAYDSSMNRLLLNLTNHRSFANKFLAIQEHLGQGPIALHKLCSLTTLCLFPFPSTPLNDGRTVNSIKSGDTIRCSIRLHTLLQTEFKEPVLRLQHSIAMIYITNE